MLGLVLGIFHWGPTPTRQKPLWFHILINFNDLDLFFSDFGKSGLILFSSENGE